MPSPEFSQNHYYPKSLIQDRRSVGIVPSVQDFAVDDSLDADDDAVPPHVEVALMRSMTPYNIGLVLNKRQEGLSQDMAGLES